MKTDVAELRDDLPGDLQAGLPELKNDLLDLEPKSSIETTMIPAHKLINDPALDDPALDPSALTSSVPIEMDAPRPIRRPPTRLPLPEKPILLPDASIPVERKSIILWLREVEQLPTVDKSGVLEISISNEEIATMDHLIAALPVGYTQKDFRKIASAYQLACYAHRRQFRETGEPYILHPIAVARILASMGMDSDTIVAALLHDVAEDSEFTLDYIQEHFGEPIANLVSGVTKLKRINELSKGTQGNQGSANDSKMESLRKMFLAMADDIRVVLIKLADRLHNMRTLTGKDEHKRRRIARETLEIYAPLANRLGIWPIKSELEDLCFRHLDPTMFKDLTKQVLHKQPENEKQVARVKVQLEQELSKAGIVVQVSGRFKHLYSIYKKMKRKNLPFDQIYDMLAFRVIVENDTQCYGALGVVHGLWRPIPGEFDDYIANPKENNYRSLHTGVFGPNGRPMEVQIRTRTMHEEAEYGIAAHWRYKEQAKFSADLQQKIAWVRQLFEWRKDISDATEFVDAMRNDVFKESVFVFTPQGEVIDLPAGSTPIDFAYAIHTELGHRCRGATLNGQMVPLDTKLKNADQVHIINAKRGGPSRDWLNPNLEYVATHRAKSKIRQWLKKQARDENIQRGRELLEREMHRLSIVKKLDDVAEIFKYDDLDDFLAAIGYGDVNIQQIAQKLFDLEKGERQETSFGGLMINVVGSDEKGLQVQGMGGMLVNLGRCCTPIPGDLIVGYITRGRGVTVHKVDCPNITHAMVTGNDKRFVDVQWATAGIEKTYSVMIHVNAFDRPGLVRDISSLVADEHVNMSDVMALTGQKNNMALIKATLQIKDTGQLMRILTRLERIPNVVEARRIVA